MSVIERTLILDGETEVDRTERKLYTLAELKAREDEDIKYDAHDRALDWLREGVMEWDWWATTLDCEVDFIREKYGFTYNPKDVSFDLDRGSYFCFGKVTDLDDKKFMRKAGIDLRRRGARECIDRLIIGVRYGYGEHNWIGFYEYECLPDYVEEMYPGISDKLHDTLRDAQDEMLKNLRDEQDYLSGEEYLTEMCEGNDYLFDARGRRA
jgi:hypothetical protein